MDKTPHNPIYIDYGATITQADRAYLREIFADDLRRFAVLSGLSVDHWLAPAKTLV